MTQVHILEQQAEARSQKTDVYCLQNNLEDDGIKEMDFSPTGLMNVQDQLCFLGL